MPGRSPSAIRPDNRADSGSNGRPRGSLLLHLACWLLVGAATEVLQLFTPDRDAQAGDWLMDALGSTGGLIVAEVGLGMQRRLAPAKPKRRRTSRRAARSSAP